MTVLCPWCLASTMSGRSWHTSAENGNVLKEELPACLAICTELGNREGDPTHGVLLLTLNGKHRDENTRNDMKTSVTFAQVIAEHCQVRNATPQHRQVLAQNGQVGPHHLAHDMGRAQQGGWHCLYNLQRD